MLLGYIIWKKSLSVDIDEIDDQHRGLIDIINTFEAASKDSDRNKGCFEIALKLKRYLN